MRATERIAIITVCLIACGALWPGGPVLAGVSCSSAFPPDCSLINCPPGQACKETADGKCECQEVPCGESLPTCKGSCPPEQTCVVSQGACICVQIGCCVDVTSQSCRDTTENDCIESMFHPGEVCSGGFCETPTPTATPTQTGTATATGTPMLTATITPTRTPVPNGGNCTTPSECASRNCVNGVCEPVNRPAPAVSEHGLLVALAFLIALGAFGVWRIRGRSA